MGITCAVGRSVKHHQAIGRIATNLMGFAYALNSIFIGISTLHVSGSLSAHHQEFLDVHRHWYILCGMMTVCYQEQEGTAVPSASAQYDTADTSTTGPEYATKHRPRSSTIDEPHGVISIKYRIYSMKMDHRIRNI
jgi:hypothetical protein